MQRSLVFLLAATLGASACASDQTDDLGQVDVSLVGQAPSGTQYRLRDAVLTIDGPGGHFTFHTEDDPNRAQINARLQSGGYTLSLATGWRLEKIVSGSGQTVHAELLSSHPLSFHVAAGEFTPVVLRFRAGADDVGLGEGDVGISIGVEEGVDGGVIDAPTAPQEIVATPASVEMFEGSTAVVNVHLAQPIMAPVTVSAFNFGNIDVSPSSLTFTPANYQVDQAVVIHTQQDVNTDDTTGLLRLSAPGMAARDINVQVQDDDVLQFVTSTGGLSVAEGLSVTFGVRLSAPISTTIPASIVSVGGGSFTVVPQQLTFTPQNSDTFQTVTVTGIHDDDILDNSGLLSLVAPSLPTVTIPVTVTDIDVQAIIASHTAVTLPEGTTQSVQVRLAFAPPSLVTIVPSSNNTAAVSVNPPVLQFTPANWNLPQVLTIAAATDTNTQPESALITLSSSGIAAITIPVTVNDTTTEQALGWPTANGTAFFPPNEVRVFRVELSGPASLERLQVFAQTILGLGQVRLAIYREAGGTPGPLVFAGQPLQAGNGAQVVQPVGGVLLQPGAYFIGLVASAQVQIGVPPGPTPQVTRCVQSMSFGGPFPTIAPTNCQLAQPLSVAAFVQQ
jgi:hypothetical protein